MTPRMPSGVFEGDGLAPAELAPRLGGELRSTSEVERSWYDTFDRRLWCAGSLLEVDRPAAAGGGPATVTLRDRRTGAVLWVARTGSLPVLADDLPRGPWQRSLGGLLGLRALVPVASARLSVAVVAVADPRGKVVAQATWERVRPGRRGRRPSPVIRVVPVRGYPGPARRLETALAGVPGCRPVDDPEHDGARPGVAPAPAAPLALDPQAPAAETHRVLLRSLWDTMEAIGPWLADPPDTEFLHDYRVGLRRSRSVLKLSDGVVSPATLAQWRPRLRALQQLTSRARDLDVFLLEFPRYAQAVPPAVAPDLEPLRALLEVLRADEQRALVAYLASADHRRLRDSYTALLAAALPTSDAPLGQQPTGTVAADRIRRAHRRLVKAGGAITPQSEPASLHDLRIRAKELRYALELYGPLYATGPVSGLVRELKRLQDNLGEYQDSEVHADQLRSFVPVLERRGTAPTRTFVAMGALAATFAGQQRQARERFPATFAAFAARCDRRRVDAVLGTPADVAP